MSLSRVEDMAITQWPDFSLSELNFSSAADNKRLSASLRNSIDEPWKWRSDSQDDSANEPGSFPSSAFLNGSPVSVHETIPNGILKRSNSESQASEAKNSSPSAQSGSSSSPGVERGEMICPLLSGQINECLPEFCGINAPCLAPVIDLPDIEDGFGSVQSHRPFSVKRSESSKTTDSNVSRPAKGQPNPAAAASRAVQKQREAVIAEAAALSAKAETPAKDRSQPYPRGRQPHSLVERRYRDNLNAKIEELHEALQKIPVTRARGRLGVVQRQCLSSSTRVRKIDILTEALNHIYQSEVDMRHMADEISRLKAQLKSVGQESDED